MSTPDFSSLFKQFRDQQPSRQMQRDVASAIAQCLEEVKDRLTYWEKSCIAGGLSALAWNLRSNPKPTDVWLRLALVNAEKALVAPSQRNESYTRKDEQIEGFTYNELNEALGQLKAEIGHGD